jgi:hypothetical protein
VLAHAGGAPEFAASILVGGGVVLGWVGLSRLRGRGFGRLPRWGGIAMIVLAPVAVVASVVVPSAWWPAPGGPRPASTASISFAAPSPGQTIAGEGLLVRIDLEGGTIVDASSTNLSPDTGHVHLFLDGEIVSMTYGLEQDVDVGDLSPGAHRLEAEFVAADHAPFNPRVVATLTFVKADV